MTHTLKTLKADRKSDQRNLKLPTTKFAAGLVAFSLAVSGFTAAPAHADETDVALAVGGLLTLFVIGKAIDDAKDKKPSPRTSVTVTTSHKPKKRTPSSHGHGGSREDARNGHFKIPSTCIVSARSRHDRTETVALENCVMKERRSAQRLPSACETRVRTKRGRSNAYELGCLTNFGYRVARS